VSKSAKTTHNPGASGGEPEGRSHDHGFDAGWIVENVPFGLFILEEIGVHQLDGNGATKFLLDGAKNHPSTAAT